MASLVAHALRCPRKEITRRNRRRVANALSQDPHQAVAALVVAAPAPAAVIQTRRRRKRTRKTRKIRKIRKIRKKKKRQRQRKRRNSLLRCSSLSAMTTQSLMSQR